MASLPVECCVKHCVFSIGLVEVTRCDVNCLLVTTEVIERERKASRRRRTEQKSQPPNSRSPLVAQPSHSSLFSRHMRALLASERSMCAHSSTNELIRPRIVSPRRTRAQSDGEEITALASSSSRSTESIPRKRSQFDNFRNLLKTAGA